MAAKRTASKGTASRGSKSSKRAASPNSAAKSLKRSPKTAAASRAKISARTTTKGTRAKSQKSSTRTSGSGASVERDGKGRYFVRFASGVAFKTPEGGVAYVPSAAMAQALAAEIGTKRRIDVTALSLASMISTYHDFVRGDEDPKREECVHQVLHELADLSWRGQGRYPSLHDVVSRALGLSSAAWLNEYANAPRQREACASAPAALRAAVTECFAKLDAWQLTVAVNAAHNKAFTLGGAMAAQLSHDELASIVFEWRSLAALELWSRGDPSSGETRADALTLWAFAHQGTQVSVAQAPPLPKPLLRTRSPAELTTRLLALAAIEQSQGLRSGISAQGVADELEITIEAARKLLRSHQAAGLVASERRPSSMGPYGLAAPPWTAYALTEDARDAALNAISVWRQHESFDEAVAAEVERTFK